MNGLYRALLKIVFIIVNISVNISDGGIGVCVWWLRGVGGGHILALYISPCFDTQTSHFIVC